MNIIERINAATTRVELDALKDEAWEHPDFDVWARFVHRAGEVTGNGMVTKAGGSFGNHSAQRAVEENLRMHAEAVELAQRIHNHAAEMFQQQCELNARIHNQMFNGF